MIPVRNKNHRFEKRDKPKRLPMFGYYHGKGNSIFKGLPWWWDYVLIIIFMIIIFSCNPPEPVQRNYMAIVTFPEVQNQMDIHSSLQVEYTGNIIQYQVKGHEPAIEGKRYIDTLYLSADPDQVMVHAQFGVQQNYLPGPVFNNFYYKIFLNDVPCLTGHYTGPDSDFDLNLPL